MPSTFDSLQIEITSKAQSANKSIDALVGKLDVLSKSLGKINSGSRNLNGLANGVDRLGRAMQTMNTVKTADFTRLANNLTKLGNMSEQWRRICQNLEEQVCKGQLSTFHNLP